MILSALYGSFYHAFHDLLLSDQEDDDHRNDGKKSSGKKNGHGMKNIFMKERNEKND